jgi:hypothetical protein
MQMGKIVFLVFLFVLFCDDPRQKLYDQYHANVSQVGDITDEMVLKYIKTYRNLKTFGISFEQYIGENPEKSSRAYSDIEKIIQ